MIGNKILNNLIGKKLIKHNLGKHPGLEKIKPVKEFKLASKPVQVFNNKTNTFFMSS